MLCRVAAFARSPRRECALVRAAGCSVSHAAGSSSYAREIGCEGYVCHTPCRCACVVCAYCRMQQAVEAANAGEREIAVPVHQRRATTAPRRRVRAVRCAAENKVV